MNAPIKRTKMIEVEYWDCGKPDCHLHKTELAAAICMARLKYGKEAWDQKLRDGWVRNLDLFRMVVNGMTFKAAGERYSITPGRARDVCEKIRRAIQRREMLNPELPNRCYAIQQIREHAGFWLKATDRYEQNVKWDE